MDFVFNLLSAVIGGVTALIALVAYIYRQGGKNRDLQVKLDLLFTAEGKPRFVVHEDLDKATGSGAHHTIVAKASSGFETRFREINDRFDRVCSEIFHRLDEVVRRVDSELNRLSLTSRETTQDLGYQLKTLGEALKSVTTAINKAEEAVAQLLSTSKATDVRINGLEKALESLNDLRIRVSALDERTRRSRE